MLRVIVSHRTLLALFEQSPPSVSPFLSHCLAAPFGLELHFFRFANVTDVTGQMVS